MSPLAMFTFIYTKQNQNRKISSDLISNVATAHFYFIFFPSKELYWLPIALSLLLPSLETKPLNSDILSTLLPAVVKVTDRPSNVTELETGFN
jgi:hypothetical protein